MIPLPAAFARVCAQDWPLVARAIEPLALLLPELLPAVLDWFALAEAVDREGRIAPFAELVLLEVDRACSAPGWSLSMRRALVVWAVEMGLGACTKNIR